MQPKAIKTCKECGNEFKPYETTQKYCSHTCTLKNQKPTLKKKIHKIKPKSKKREKEDSEYLQLRKEFLLDPKNLVCPVTGQRTNQIHHKKGRLGSLFLDVRYWLGVSAEGHERIERNPDWAKKMGYSLDRLKKTDPHKK